MDIKLKKFNPYARKIKVFLCTVLYISLTIMLACGIVIVPIAYNDKYTFLLDSADEPYFETKIFKNQYNQLIRDVVNINIAYKNEENIKSGELLDYDKLLQTFSLDFNLNFDIVKKIFQTTYMSKASLTYEIPYFYENEAGEKVFRIETLAISDEIINIFNRNFSSYVNEAIEKQLTDYRRSISNLASFRNFGYILENKETGDIISNITESVFLKSEFTTTIEPPYTFGMFTVTNDEYNYYDDKGVIVENYIYDNMIANVEDVLVENNYMLKSCIISPIKAGDLFYMQNVFFTEVKQLLPYLYIGLIVTIIVSVMLTSYLIYFCGRNTKDEQINLHTIDYIYNDVQTVFVTFFVYMSYIFISKLVVDLIDIELTFGFRMYLIMTFICIILLVKFTVVLSYLLSTVRQLKARVIIKNTIIYNSIRFLAEHMGKKTFVGFIILSIVGYGCLNIFLGIFIMSGYFNILLSIVIVLIINAFFIGAYIRSFKSLELIMKSVKEISIGNTNHKINLDDISSTFKNFAKAILQIQYGLKKAIDNAVKGERMRTDLITNVSHDLKTPLTSIISYVYLLDKLNLDDDSAKKYIAILMDKSERLKHLIDDLIEANRASSGNMTVKLEKLNIKMLLVQALGEFEDKLSDVNLTIVSNYEIDAVVLADGKYMWRVFENILSNIVKYAMSETRVYIDIKKEKNYAVISFKNVSKTHIEVSANLLVERFIRGESSRTTEGSGLGLSITKSLVDLQKGELYISVDGDLYKIVVKLPLINASME